MLPHRILPSSLVLLLAANGCDTAPEVSSVPSVPSNGTGTAPTLPELDAASAEGAPVPLYALIPTGPRSARLLWVPWPGAAASYEVERQSGGPASKWLRVPADVRDDHALVTDLAEGDALRVIALTAQGERLGTSVDLRFAPVSAAPRTIGQAQVVDGRGASWEINADHIVGTGEAPRPGDVLVLPIRAGHRDDLLREVSEVRPTINGWRADTRAFRYAGAPGTHVGATLNVSADGVPARLLKATGDGRLGYCSESGWGCLELEATEVLLAESRARNSGYEGILRQTWSTELDVLGMAVDVSAEGGVVIEANYQLSYSWYVLPTGFEFATIKTTPYAEAHIAASLDTATGHVPSFEKPVLPPISVVLYTAVLLTIEARLGIDAIAELEDQGVGGVSGAWTGTAEIARTYEIGYQAARARGGSSGFYGPQATGQYFDVGIAPAFGDGSRARTWFGWRATGSVVLSSAVGDLARASLAATTGLVFAHDSTDGAPCAQAVSIAHADIGLGARLDAELDLMFFDPWRFPIADRTVPILGWGRRRALAAPRQVTSDATSLDFRLRNLDFGPDHDHPTAPGGSGSGLGVPIDADRDVTSQPGPGGVQMFLDEHALDATQHPLVIGPGQYTQAHPALAPGLHTIALWMPDNPLAPLRADTLLRAPGQCVSATVEVAP